MDDKILFNQLKDFPEGMSLFTESDSQAALSMYSEQDQETLTTMSDSEKSWHLSRALYLAKSQEAAKSIGLEIHPTLAFNHNPIAVIDFAKGIDAGHELMAKFNFNDGVGESGYCFYRDSKLMPTPETMWHVLATRRDGDAVIAFIGDDRGWEKHWEYFVAVAWAPQELVEELGYIPALL
jgi:hypothetical protein